MTSTNESQPEELVRRAEKLVPLLRSYAGWAEENRRLHPEVVEAMAEAGLLKMRVPARYGGFESDMRTMVDVGTALGKGDGAAAWCAMVWWIPAWMVGLFSDQAQDEVFATPDVRVCGTLSPSAQAVAVPGGYKISGRWSFISGAWHSHWQQVLAMAVGADGEPTEPVMALVPMSDLERVDDWYAAGLKGSGSITTVAEEVFVPSSRTLPMADIMTGRHASESNVNAAMYQTPLIGATSGATVGALLGLATAAREEFLDSLPGRRITYTNYDQQREAPVTHLQVAEADLKVDEAAFHAYRMADFGDDRARCAQPWTIEERARAKADVGAVARLSADAIDILASASGGASVYTSAPIQRIARDIRAANLHALIYPATNFELYGRILCGLEPNTNYL